MCASRSSAGWPQMVAIALMGMGFAGCSANSGRFSDIFGADRAPRGEVTGSIPPSGDRVESHPLPHLAGNDGWSGGGRGMGSYQPGSGDVTGSLPPPRHLRPASPGKAARRLRLRRARRWRRFRSVTACLSPQSWKQTASPVPATVRPGEHLVIPRRRGPGSALSAPQTRIARRHAQCLPRRRSVRREPHWRRPRASTSWRRARRCTASRAFTASRLWRSPRPTIFRPTRW